MARTKREQDRDAKRDEIVAAARRLFVDEGFEAASISRLATAVGVAPNTLYWYFKDKDEVLVAVLDAEFSARMAEYLLLPPGDVTERLLWVAQQLDRVRRLVATVHARLEKSPALNAWHERFHALSEEMLRVELRQAGVAEAAIGARVKISVFAIEGMLAHPLPEAEKRAICAALAAG
ncbi:MAG: TetR family transcriptional regulator [Moraxellaceae bacterium]|jgi:AcrR family transcriptional regulator|nr:TetR family transcriptional regulator [Moraxellaceae bacterium]